MLVTFIQKQSVFLVILIYFRTPTLSVPIDNSVLGEPQIECSMESVNFETNTRNNFYGKIYVKGQYANSQCVLDKTQTKEQMKNIAINITFGLCNVERKRSVNPKGVFLRTTIVIQFHSSFVTKVDKAYQINCFYQEAVKTVSASLEVSMINTEVFTNTYSMPTCVYNIRKDNLINGTPVRFAKVGDSVVHRWDCGSENEKESAYGMLVHSCFVYDGTGKGEKVVDEKGCGLDPYILGHLTYSDDLLSAYREAHVFKFADQSALYFSCQIRLCMKTMDACRGMTPPKCLTLINRRDLSKQLTSTNESQIGESSNLQSASFGNDVNDVFDVRSGDMIVLDYDDAAVLSLKQLENDEITNYICLTVQTTTMLCFAAIVIILAVGTSTAFFLSQRRRYVKRLMEELIMNS